MRLFKHKEKEEYFVSPDGDKFFAISDGNTYTGNKDTLKEIKQVTESKPVIKDFKRHHIIEETASLEDFKDWHLKDVLFVPVDGKEVAFRVEHITYDKIYFVAVDAVEKVTMDDIDIFLKTYLDKMPKSLVKKMTEMEHLLGDKITHRGKLMLLSCGNIAKDEEHNGKDDIFFDGFVNGSGRCKNLNKETNTYWIDIPKNNYRDFFNIVCCSGDFGVSYNKNSRFAVVPCFSIYR